MATAALCLIRSQPYSQFSVEAFCNVRKVIAALCLIRFQPYSHFEVEVYCNARRVAAVLCVVMLFTYITVSFHLEVRIGMGPYHSQGSSRFSYMAVSFHPEVRIGLRPYQTHGGNCFLMEAAFLLPDAVISSSLACFVSLSYIHKFALYICKYIRLYTINWNLYLIFPHYFAFTDKNI